MSFYFVFLYKYTRPESLLSPFPSHRCGLWFVHGSGCVPGGVLTAFASEQEAAKMLHA